MVHIGMIEPLCARTIFPSADIHLDADGFSLIKMSTCPEFLASIFIDHSVIFMQNQVRDKTSTNQSFSFHTRKATYTKLIIYSQLQNNYIDVT